MCIFEKLLAMYFYTLISKESKLELYPPIGMFSWQPFYLERGQESTFKEFFEAVEIDKDKSLLLKEGMFEGSFEKYKEAYDAVTEMEKKAAQSWY